MGGLFTSVILVEAGKMTLQVMCVHCLQKAFADSFARLSLAPAHLVPPIRSTAPAHVRGAFQRLILPRAESLEQEEISRVPGFGQSEPHLCMC
jgi:hypothetical protein